MSSSTEEKNKNQNKEEISTFDKLLELNKLASLFLSSGNNQKAIIIFEKTYSMYQYLKEKNEFPFFYGNLIGNLAKAYSCEKQFEKAKELYIKVINEHPYGEILREKEDYLRNEYLIDINCILEIHQLTEENDDIELKHEKLMRTFKIKEINEKEVGKNEKIETEARFDLKKKYYKNNLNSVSSYVDSLINLSVLNQIICKNSISSYNMYYLSLLCDPHNDVGNINYNNFLRENNYKCLSDEFITCRVKYDQVQLEVNRSHEQNHEFISSSSELPYLLSNQYNKQVNLSFICMKWGKKYSSAYVNKLYNGIKRNSPSNINYDIWCITDDNQGLDESIKIIDLTCEFKGWMKKSFLFSKEVTSKLGVKVCFIDLDMIIYNDINFIFNYNGDFCLMNTNDIACEGSTNGYNSSIILWRNGFGEGIYQYIKKNHDFIVKQVVRFDHYLEYIIKNVDFIQEEFKNKVLDYNTYCKDKSSLPDNGAIIAFPRYPKPHECNEKWIFEYWI